MKDKLPVLQQLHSHLDCWLLHLVHQQKFNSLNDSWQIFLHAFCCWFNGLGKRPKPTNVLVTPRRLNLRPQHLCQSEEKQHLLKILDLWNGLNFWPQAIQDECDKVSTGFCGGSLESHGFKQSLLPM